MEKTDLEANPARLGVRVTRECTQALYDQVLKVSSTFGNLPERFENFAGDFLDNYFRVARGRSVEGEGLAAGEMTKWFDTNYHYIVPEFLATTTFRLDAARLIDQLREAKAAGVSKCKPVIIGPLTYLALGKAKDESEKLELLLRLLPVYWELLRTLAADEVEWVQIDEPILVTELSPDWQEAFRTAYADLDGSSVKLLVATYFGQLLESLPLAAELPVEGLHLERLTSAPKWMLSSRPFLKTASCRSA